MFFHGHDVLPYPVRVVRVTRLEILRGSLSSDVGGTSPVQPRQEPRTRPQHTDSQEAVRRELEDASGRDAARSGEGGEGRPSRLFQAICGGKSGRMRVGLVLCRSDLERPRLSFQWRLMLTPISRLGGVARRGQYR